MQFSRIHHISDLLRKEGFPLEENVQLFLTEARVRKFKIYKAVEEVYQNLGGEGKPPFPEVSAPLIIDQQPIFVDGFLHFNRYRLMTLKSDIYSDWNDFPLAAYRRHCRKFENECLKSGKQQGVWSNPDAVKYFGQAAPAGDFFGNGASGWKWVAYQTFLQDIAVRLRGQESVRISMYDELLMNGRPVRLHKLMESRKEEYEEKLRDFFNNKVKGVVKTIK